MSKEGKLKRAAIKGDTGKVRELLDGGVDANARDKDCSTLLYATAEGRTETAELLAGHGGVE